MIQPWVLATLCWMGVGAKLDPKNAIAKHVQTYTKAKLG